MFSRLRHHSFVCRDNEHDEVESAGAGDHGSHKFFVARNVDDRDTEILGEVEGRETQFDRYASRLFFRKTVEVATRERANEGGLAVIDMPGGAED